jgi:hypothetical protein
MINCVNTNSKEFKALAEQININPKILAAKISLWQDTNGVDNFPSLQDLQGVEKPFEKKVESLLSFLENYGFDVQESEDLVVNLAAKKIDLNTADISQVAKAISAPLAEMLSYSDAYYEIEKAVVETDRYKEIFSDLLSQYTDSTKRNLKRLATKQIFRELLEKGFSEELAADFNIEKSLWDKIVDFVTSVVNQLKDLDWNAVDKNISNIVEKTFKGEDYIRLTKKEGYKQVDFQQAFDENEIAKDIMTTIGTNPNIVLTGSIAYATQGTVYRKIETVVHDLDFVNTGLSEQEIEALVLDNYPDALKAYSFFDKYKVDTYLIPPAGFKIDNIQRRETGKITSYEILNESNEIVGTYNLEYDVSSTGKTINETENKQGVEAMLVDFFSEDTIQRETVSFPFKGSDNTTHQVQLSKFDAPFEAKLTYSRFKDIWDYNRFIPKKENEEDFALPLNSPIKNDLNFSEQEFRSFRQDYHSKEDTDLAAQVIDEAIRDAIGYTATSYKIERNDKGLISRVIINPTERNQTVTAINNITKNVLERVKNIAHPSFFEGREFATIVSQVANVYANQIRFDYTPEVIQAFAEGMEHFSKETLEEYMYNRFLESKNIEVKSIDTVKNAKQELKHLKTLPHSQFQGFYNTVSGEFFSSLQDWKNFVSTFADYNENLNEEEDFALSVNNPNNSLFIDPTYEYYPIKRKGQIKKVEKQINTLKAKERIEGSSPNLSDRIAYLQQISESLSKDILDFEKSLDVFETVKAVLYRDLELVRNLISTPNIENFFLAQDIVDFMEINLDFANSNSQLFKAEGKTPQGKDKKFEPKVLDLLKEVRAESALLVLDMNSKRETYFLGILSKYENNIKQLYPNKTLEEIKDLLLSNLEDITSFERDFMTQGKNIVTESDIIGELIRLEYDIQVEKEKPKVQRLIKKINTLVPKVEKELAKLGFVTTLGKGVEGVSKFSFYNYQALFYRKDDKGNILPTLVSKFSGKWDKFISGFNYEMKDKLFKARYAKDWNLVESLLKEKFYKLNANVNFIDFRKLEDVSNLITDPKLKALFSSNSTENSAYKQSVIDEIGLPEYEAIVQKQVSLLQSFLTKERQLIAEALKKEGVRSYDDLSDFVKENIEASLQRYNPATFLESLSTPRQGLVNFTIGTQNFDKYSYLEYNTYYPKKNDYQNQDTGYFDKDFEIIEGNTVLKEFWPVVEEALYLINDNLIGSDLRLNSRTILQMQKGILENAVNKGFYESAKGLASKDTVQNSVQYLKDIFSASKVVKTKELEVQLPNTINSFQNIVNKEFEFTRLQIANILETTLKDNTELNWAAISSKNKELIYEALGVTNEGEFLKQITLSSQGTFKVRDLKIFDRIAAIEQQTFDLPSLLKALLEQAAIHKARLVAKDNIDVLRRTADEKIKAREGKTETPENTEDRKSGTPRTNAQKRTEFFYENVVLNESNKSKDINFSKFQKLDKYEKKYANGELIDPDEMFKYLLNAHFKNFTPQEKIQYRILKKRWDVIKKINQDPKTTDKEREALEQEKASIEQRVTLMGKDYMASTLLSNVLNKGLAIGIGLGYASVGMMYNYLNARANFFHRDGEFWEEGNAYPAWAFVDMHATRHINPNYNEQWKIMEAFVHQLDLVQDGTNELQRAKKTSVTKSPKIWNLKRWAQNPMYGTELIEWYNQIPVMLAMGADIKIKSATTGKQVPLFDGTGFPAHEIDKATGQLKLKDEFRTPENIEDYENFDSEKINLWKTQANRAIQSLNGDYSVSGVIRAKGNVFGQTLMLFKTWAGEYYHSRWAIDQKSVAFGQRKDGFITGSLTNKDTRKLAGTMLALNVGAGVLMTPMVSYGIGLLALTGVGGLALTGAIAGAAYFKKRHSLSQRLAQQAVPSTLSWQQTLMYLAKATTVGTVEMPINKAWNVARLVAGTVSGKPMGPKTLINIDSTFNGALDKRSASNLRNLTRMFQKSNTSVLIAILAQLLLGDAEDEEDEAVGKEGTEQRKRHLAQKEKRENKKFIFNAVKNINQREFDEMNLAQNLNGTVNLFIGDESTSLSSTEGISKVLSQAAIMDSEELYNRPGSMYHGDSKGSVFMRKAFLPQMFRNIGKDEYMFGFEIVGDREYQQTDLIDKMFETDMKKDKKEQKITRQKIKLVKEQEVAKKYFNKDYRKLSTEEKIKADAQVKRELKGVADYQYKTRKDYDDEQNLIE